MYERVCVARYEFIDRSYPVVRHTLLRRPVLDCYRRRVDQTLSPDIIDDANDFSAERTILMVWGRPFLLELPL